MIAVKFNVNHAPYKAGDIAGVDDAEVAGLERAGIATAVGGESKAKGKKKSVSHAPVDKQMDSPVEEK